MWTGKEFYKEIHSKLMTIINFKNNEDSGIWNLQSLIGQLKIIYHEELALNEIKILKACIK
jgi:hypothetical protein